MKRLRKSIYTHMKQYISPMFLALLCLSFFLWYMTKLSYTYTAEVPVKVNVAGNKFRVTAVARGAGLPAFLTAPFPGK